MRASLFITMLILRAPAMKIWRLGKRLHHHGVTVEEEALLAHHLAGGDINLLTESLLLAERQHLGVSFDRLCAIDLSTRTSAEGVNVLDIVKQAAEPRVYRVPEEGFREFSAPACPTWRLAFRLHHTTNLDRYVGGATLDKLASEVTEFVSRFYRECEGRPHSRLATDLQAAIMSASLDARCGYNLTACEVETR